MAEEKFVMALDQGTTSSRAIIFNKKAKPVKEIHSIHSIYKCSNEKDENNRKV